jgi:hypothetical protein
VLNTSSSPCARHHKAQSEEGQFNSPSSENAGIRDKLVVFEALVGFGQVEKGEFPLGGFWCALRGSRRV